MSRPRALVYRSKAFQQDGEDLSEPVAALLQSSPYQFHVTFVGPKEAESLDVASLSTADLLAMPGGPDLRSAYRELRHARSHIRAYVKQGGRYLGICLGAFLGGYTPGFGLLPEGADTDAECSQKGSQVRTDRDAIIQIDYTYSSGERANETYKNQWIFYQGGACITGFRESATNYIVAKYSKDGRTAATISQFGEGWVGLIGPHPEADQSWFDDCDLPAPHGLRYDIGYDFIDALMRGQVARPATSGKDKHHEHGHSTMHISSASTHQGLDSP